MLAVRNRLIDSSAAQFETLLSEMSKCLNEVVISQKSYKEQKILGKCTAFYPISVLMAFAFLNNYKYMGIGFIDLSVSSIASTNNSSFYSHIWDLSWRKEHDNLTNTVPPTASSLSADRSNVHVVLIYSLFSF